MSPPPGCETLEKKGWCHIFFLQSWCLVNVGSVNAYFLLDRKGSSLHILDASHARLINDQWDFGKNEWSFKYIERCLQNFPGFGLLGPEGLPVSWIVMEQSCELRMAYTVPEYRSQGNMWEIGFHLVEYLTQRKIPFYIHVADKRERAQQMVKIFGFNEVSCGWHQWQCTPKKYR